MATTWTVNIAGGADFTSIQAAINAASAGDTILVSIGIYDELLTITKSLTILGAQANVNPKLGGRAGGETVIQSSVVGSGNRPVQIAASGIVFSGFEITNFFYGIQIPNSSFTPTVEDITLSYNYIHSTVCFVGIVSEGGTLRNFTVSHNIVHVGGTVTAGSAVNLTGPSTPRYENINISNNEMQSVSGGNTLFAGANPATYLINNIVIGCNHFTTPAPGSNFNMGNILNGSFINNVVDFTGGSIGIDTGVIYGNTFSSGGALSLWGTEFGFTRPSQNVFISYNNFTDEVNGLGIRLRTGVLADTILLNLNAFQDSGIPPSTPPDFSIGYLIRNFGTGTLDATNNWWGSAAGPAGNTGGVTGAMVTTPWLLSYTLSPSQQVPPTCWPLSDFLLTQPGFWIYPEINQLLFSVSTHGAIATVGNTLGLWGQFAPPNPAGGAAADGIGAFISTNTGLVFDGYPAGSTPLFAENSSANVLTLPAGSTILKAYLFYSGTQTNSVQDVTAFINQAVTFTPPSGSPVQLTPDALTSIVSPTTGSTAYHAMKDITASMEGSGSYQLGAVPCALGVSNFTGLENNYVGWTIVVLYSNASLPIADLTIWDIFTMVFTGSTADIPLSGFVTAPAGTPGGKLFIGAGNGDNYVAGDQTLFGPNIAGLTALFGVNNGANNFYQSQINDDNGALQTTGTFGGTNQPFGGSAPAPTLAAARQGWDKTAIDVSSILTNNQTAALIRLTDPELYFPQYIALQAALGAPAIAPSKTAVTTAAVGTAITYTIKFTNTGTVAADNVVITDPLPTGTVYVPGSITANVPVTGDPTTAIQLTASLAPGQTATIGFKASIAALPTPNPMLNIATVNYDYVPGVGLPAVPVTVTTNAASTLVFEASRGVLFI